MSLICGAQTVRPETSLQTLLWSYLRAGRGSQWVHPLWSGPCGRRAPCTSAPPTRWPAAPELWSLQLGDPGTPRSWSPWESGRSSSSSWGMMGKSQLWYWLLILYLLGSSEQLWSSWPTWAQVCCLELVWGSRADPSVQPQNMSHPDWDPLKLWGYKQLLDSSKFELKWSVLICIACVKVKHFKKWTSFSKFPVFVVNELDDLGWCSVWYNTDCPLDHWFPTWGSQPPRGGNKVLQGVILILRGVRQRFLAFH